jgi:hypothetical protein
MTSDPLSTLARCKSLALARMIEAGGKPCWVAGYAPDSSPAARPCTPPPPRKWNVAPQYRPTRGPLVDPPQPRRSPPTAPPPASPDCPAAATLTARESALLSAFSPAARATIARALARVSAAATSPPPLARSVDAHGGLSASRSELGASMSGGDAID